MKLITTHGLLSWWSKTKTECYSSIEVFRVDILLHLKNISTLFSFLLLLLVLLLSFITRLLNIYCLTNIFLGHENHKKQGLCLSEKSLYADSTLQPEANCFHRRVDQVNHIFWKTWTRWWTWLGCL